MYPALSFRLSGSSCIDIPDQHFHTVVYSKPAAVDGQLVITGITPLGITMTVVIVFTLSVHFLDIFSRLFVRQAVLFHNTCHLTVHIAVDEDRDHTFVIF